MNKHTRLFLTIFLNGMKNAVLLHNKADTINATSNFNHKIYTKMERDRLRGRSRETLKKKSRKSHYICKIENRIEWIWELK